MQIHRRYLKTISLLSLSALFFTTTSMWAGAAAQTYHEAPQLAQLVVAGELPPVEERLPKEPMIVSVVERIGEYGGQWNTGIVGIGDFERVSRPAFYDHLVRWDEERTGVIPNIAKSWDVTEDATEYTFHLREGMKWSDGKPFTSADILFWAEDVVGNEELFPAGQPSWLQIEGVPAEVIAPDEYTVVFELAGPNGLFLQRLATVDGKPMVSVQAEYAKQFHIKYNPEVNELARQEGFSDWVELFQSKVSAPGGTGPLAQNPELPRITAWRLVTPSTSRVVLERNPYYWKVDPEGNQLPYIDRIVADIVQDTEVLLLKTMGGEVDLIISQGIPVAENRPILFDNQERGNYRFLDIENVFMNQGMIALNLTHKNPVKREIFNNKLFRQALSVAVNRQEIIDLILVGQGEPWQGAPRPGNALYNEELAKQFTEYDPEQAAAWLDEIGYTVGSDGVRLGPDGQPISFVVESPNHRPDYGQIAEMAVRNWQAIGIDAHHRTMVPELRNTRRDSNEHDASIFIGSGGGFQADSTVDPRWYMPFSTSSEFAVPWAYWYSNPTHPLAEEPPAHAKRQMELYDKLLQTANLVEQTRLMQEILEIAQESFYAIGTARETSAYGIVSNDLHNVPAGMNDAHIFQDPGGHYSEQFFITR